jgi:hypothetical protein
MNEDRLQKFEAMLAELMVNEVSGLGAEYFNQSLCYSEVQKNISLSVSQALQLEEPLDYARRFSLRLRIALHFSPVDAVQFDRKSRHSRWELIQNHLVNAFGFSTDFSGPLARSVAKLLDSWDEERKGGLSVYKRFLLQKQVGKCAYCRVDLESESRIADEEMRVHAGTEDLYKPYFDGEGVQSRMAAAVDHRMAISGYGTNKVDNLQVVCTLCNQGKGNGLPIGVGPEFEFAAKKIREIPDSHRIRMFFNRLRMDQFRCSKCLTSDRELTVRQRRERGGYVLTNLQTLCVVCCE